MSSITEQFSAATKSQLEAQFKIFSSLASTAVGSAEKVIALNINTTKASVEKTSAAAKKLWSAKDPKEFFSLSAAEPAGFESLLAYGRALYSIATNVQSELIKSAQSTLKQVTDLSVVKASVPALTAAASTAVAVVEKLETAVVAPSAPKVKPAAPIAVPEEDSFIEVKAEAKPGFPVPKPIALAAETKPPKPTPKAKPLPPKQPK